MTELCEALAQNLEHFYFFDKLSGRPMGVRFLRFRQVAV